MKKLDRVNQKIQAAIGDKSQVSAQYKISDESVQAELRLHAQWAITAPVDKINYPKELNPDRPDRALWQQMVELEQQIYTTALLVETRIPKGYYSSHIIPINTRRNQGGELRAEAKQAWEIEMGLQFLADYRRVIKKSTLARVRQSVSALQVQQKVLLPQLRASNAAYFAARKIQNAERTRKNTEALISGRFWEAEKETLKNYFHPPFDRNYLADISGKWRAALYTEMKSTAWKARPGDWRHKNIGTGNGYLCGIDDNGDEWGHRIDLSTYLSHDIYGDMGYAGVTVEDAMAVLFEVEQDKLDKCIRQGDLLFCSVKLRKQPWETDTCQKCGMDRESHYYGDPPRPSYFVDCNQFVAKIATPVELHPHEGPWEIRESHEVLSTGLTHNGRYFASPNPIYMRHTSHPMQTLPPGEYRLYELLEVEAD